MVQDAQTVQVRVHLPIDLHTALKVKAAIEHKTIAQAVTEAIAEWVGESS